MRCPRQYRKWMNWMRSRYGKKNGVVGKGLLDSPYHERMLAKSRKQRSRKSRKMEMDDGIF